MSNVRYMYIRGHNKEPIGCVAIAIYRNKNRVEYGLSMRHPNDAFQEGKPIRFDRKTAQLLSKINLEKNANRTFITTDANMHEITMSVLTDIIARGEAPSNAVRFAKHWLRSALFIH